MHLNDDEQILHFYGESGREARAHLLECVDCRDRNESLARFLREIPATDVPEPEEGWEDSIWDRIEPELPRARVVRWRRWMPIAAAIILTFLAGVFVRDLVELDSAAPAEQTLITDAEGRERVFLLVVSDHFDRTERVLLELRNLDPTGLDQVQLDAAEDLLETNRMYRLTARQKGDGRIENLLGELELVLLELARSEGSSVESLESLRERIEEKELVFRVRVVNTQLKNEKSSMSASSTSI